MLLQNVYTMMSAAVGYVLFAGFVALVALLALARRRVARRSRELPEAPTVDELVELGYDRGVATAALRHLAAERAAGRMRCYTYLGRGGGWSWYVTLETVRATAKPSDYRWDLGDWVSAWIRGTLPVGSEGGAA